MSIAKGAAGLGFQMLALGADVELGLSQSSQSESDGFSEVRIMVM